MTLPLVSGAAGDRRRRLLAGAVACVLLLAGRGAVAQVPAPSEDPYSATVKVDATAANVVKAREQARLGGQRHALTEIVDRLAGGQGDASLPKLDDDAITDMVVSFEVANERMSTVRYTADYTFHFRPADVQRLLRTAGISLPAPGAVPAPGAAPAAEAAAGPAPGGQPALVLPVYQAGAQSVLWEDPNPWRDAWAQVQAGPEAALTVPFADVGDVATIDADKANAGDSSAIAAVGKKYGAGDVVVATAAARGAAAAPTGLDIGIKRYRAGQVVAAHTVSLAANPGESADAFFRRAAQTVADAIGRNWQGMPAPTEPQSSLTAIVPISGLDDWLRLRDRIAGLPPIRRITLRALSRQQARIELGYVGDIDQLKTSLAALGVQLVEGDSGWRLLPAAAAGPQ